MKIRAIKKNEIKFASEIVGKNYDETDKETSFLEINAMFNNLVLPPKYLVAEENKKIIGFGGYIQSWMDYHVYNIFWVNVDPKSQDKGVGTKIVNKIINEIKSKKRKENKADMILLTTTNPSFYKKRFGFKTLTKFGQKKHSLLGLILD